MSGVQFPVRPPGRGQELLRVDDHDVLAGPDADRHSLGQRHRLAFTVVNAGEDRRAAVSQHRVSASPTAQVIAATASIRALLNSSEPSAVTGWIITAGAVACHR
jgi:hypothetical protein